MSLSISQIIAVSYNDVLTDQRKPHNQWAENAFLRYLEKMKFIERRNFGPKIEVPIDYRRNPGTTFLTSSLQPLSLAKTEVLSAAEYEIGELAVPIVWERSDEVKNPSENQKINFSKALLANGFDSHDEALEEALFATLTGNVNGLAGLVPDDGEGTVGTIDASDEVFWRNPTDTYLADGSDFDSVLEEQWFAATKGSGSTSTPTLLISGSEALALFNSTQVAMQRFSNTQKLEAGFVTTAFKTADWAFSQFGDDHVYGLSPKAFKLLVSKGNFRDKGETKPLEGKIGNWFEIYSALQAVVANKSRLFVVSEAA